MSTNQCNPTGLAPDQVAQYDAGAFDSCTPIALPGLEIKIGVKIRCTDAGPRVTIFETNWCNESTKLRHAYIGKSGGCMLLTGAGHFASLSWKGDECKEGPVVQASDRCQSKSNELHSSEPVYSQDLYDCEQYHCPEIRRFNGVIDYGEMKSDCTCTVGYKYQQTKMEKCRALPGGARTCFVTYKVENKNGARLHIGNGIADCIPYSCLGTKDLAALTRQWTLSCLDIPGVSTCFASVKCVDPPETTTAAPEDSYVNKAVVAGAQSSFRTSAMTLCGALPLLCLNLL